MKYFLTIILSFLILLGCKKDEELISGDIKGTVSLVRSNYSFYPPTEDIQVDLYSHSEKINSTKTDENGDFSFEGLPYGRYAIRCSYSGFIRPYNELDIFHIGGYSATIADAQLYHVPEYQISIDSVSYDATYDFLNIHLKVDGDTIAPEGSRFFHQFRAFMSNSPDVSSENYALATKGFLADWIYPSGQVQVAIYGMISFYDIPYSDFEDLQLLPIYMVVYPISNNQGHNAEQYLAGSLGKPSNEVVFDWNEISGQ